MGVKTLALEFLELVLQTAVILRLINLTVAARVTDVAHLGVRQRLVLQVLT